MRSHAGNEAKRMGQNRFNAPTTDRFEDAKKKVLRQGYRHHRGLDLKHGPPTPPPTCGRTKQRLGKNLPDALRDHRAEVLRFIYGFEVPFTIHAVERDIRMIKIKLMITG